VQLVGAPRDLSQREDAPPQALAHEVDVVSRAELLAHGAQGVADGRWRATGGRGNLLNVHAGEDLQEDLALVVGDWSGTGLRRGILFRARHHDRMDIGPRLEWRTRRIAVTGAASTVRYAPKERARNCRAAIASEVKSNGARAEGGHAAVTAVDRGTRALAVVWVLACTTSSCRAEAAQSMLKLVTEMARCR
jgi:hypothetical protein